MLQNIKLILVLLALPVPIGIFFTYGWPALFPAAEESYFKLAVEPDYLKLARCSEDNRCALSADELADLTTYKNRFKQHFVRAVAEKKQVSEEDAIDWMAMFLICHRPHPQTRVEFNASMRCYGVIN